MTSSSTGTSPYCSNRPPHRNMFSTNMVKEVDDPKHLSVFLSRNGTTRKDVTERLRKARKHVNTLHHFWRHTGLPLHWKLRTYNAVFVPMIVYSMESAAFTQPDLHRIVTHRASARCTEYLPRFYTKVLAPDQPATSNQQRREQSSQPPRTHHIDRAQLTLFGHVLRARKKCLERSCCFTKSIHHRDCVLGSGLRRGRPKYTGRSSTPCRHGTGYMTSLTLQHKDTRSSFLLLFSFTGWLSTNDFGVG